MNGFINFFKPSDMSSALALSKIKKALGKQKCGHMGTLDPLASGVLPVAVGKSTRLFDFLLDKVKEYKATFTFGYETDTFDLGGKIVKTSNVIPTIEEVKKESLKWVGQISQLPPKFSAKKINGERGYDLARKGIDFELSPKKVEIISIDVSNSIKENSYDFTIKCKGGTYIRSICRDIAYGLNTVATMTKLVRTSSGYFNIENSITIEDLEKVNLESLIIPPQNVLSFTKINLTEKEYTYLINGRILQTSYEDNLYSLFYNGEFVGVGIVENSILKIKAYIKD